MTLNKNNKPFRFQITVIIASYNPDVIKLKRTIYSVVRQKNISLQLIITDDGSKNNLFYEAEQFLKELNFNDYELISGKVNSGTVKNIYKALKYVQGEYIKLISPGDYLYLPETLSKWFKYVKDNNYDLSFGAAVYYSEENNRLRYEKDVTNPGILRIYGKDQNPDTIRKYYVVFEDITLGASTLCRASSMKKYMDQIVGKVIYAEDGIYRIMHADGIVQGYCNFPVIWYEADTGISRGQFKKWKTRLMNDYSATDEIIVNRQATDKLEWKMQRILKQRRGSYRRTLLKIVYFPDILLYKVKRIFNKKEYMTMQSAEESFFYEALNYVVSAD
ncbi:MAG: glycosyltransferase family 2 protein [Candidatus Weimeria sp.]